MRRNPCWCLWPWWRFPSFLQNWHLTDMQAVTCRILWLVECAVILMTRTNEVNGLYPGRNCPQSVNWEITRTLENSYRDHNGKGLITPKSFAVPIILEDSCVLAFVNPMPSPLLAHFLLSHRAFKDISKWSIVLPLSRTEIHQFHRRWAAITKKRVERVWGDKLRHAVSSASVCSCLRWTKEIHFHYSGKIQRKMHEMKMNFSCRI